MNRAVAVLAVLGVLAGAGCDGERKGAQPARSSGSPSAVASPSPSSSPSPSAGPLLTTQPMTAADGQNTDACQDGSCEVLVSAGTQFQYTDSNGTGTVSVDSVSADGITISIAAGITAPGIPSGPHQGKFAEINGVQFVAVAVRGSSGVLRLVRGQSS